jgi:hypothetical protein
MAPTIDKKRISAEGRRLAEEILDSAAPARREINKISRAPENRFPVLSEIHQLRPDVVLKIQTEISRLSGPGRPAHVRKFAEAMSRRYPELANL